MKKIALAVVILAIGVTGALWVSDAIASSPRNISLEEAKYFIVAETYSGVKQGYYSDDVEENRVSITANGYWEFRSGVWRYSKDDLRLNLKDYKSVTVTRRY